MIVHRPFYTLSLALLVLITTVSATATNIAAEPGTSAIHYDLQAQDLSTALSRLCIQAGMQLVFPSHLAKGLTSPDLRGRYTLKEALNQLLQDSGLNYRIVGGNVLVIYKQKTIINKQRLNIITTTDKNIDKQSGIEEISVISNQPRKYTTANKRRQYPQDTAISLTALNSHDIHYAGVTKISDLALQTPGLVVGNAGHFVYPEIYIRGVGTRLSGASSTKIGFYIDEINIAQAGGMFIDLFDLERIEILKGPQDTLWGGNTLGGVIHIVSKKPSNDFKARHKIRLGNFNHIRASGTINGPIVNEHLSAKFSYSVENRDGYIENISGSNNLANADTLSVRTAILSTPTEDTEVLLRADIAKDRPLSAGFDPTILKPILGGLFGNTRIDEPPFNHVEPLDPHKVNYDINTKEHRDSYGWSIKFLHETNNLLFTSNTAARYLDIATIDNSGGTSLDLIVFEDNSEQNQISQEFTLSNNINDTLDWLAGIYIFHEDINRMLSTSAQDLNLYLAPILGFQNYLTTNFSKATNSNYSVFGEGNYKFSENLSITLGGRYTYEEKKFQIRKINNEIDKLIFGSDIPLTKSGRDWKVFTPKINLKYKPTENLLYYANISKGFQSGNFNSEQFTLQDDISPEFMLAYELGMKSNWLQEKLKINLSAFHYNHKDIQITSAVNGNSFTTNAARSKNYGLEAELLATPTDNLQINTHFTFLDAKFKKFINANNLDVSGNNVINSPKFSANLGIQYIDQLKTGSTMTLRGEYQYNSKIYFTETNEDILSQDGNFTINARIEYQPRHGKYTFGVFGRNLTNEHIAHAAFDLRDITGVITTLYKPPRTFGIELSLDI